MKGRTALRACVLAGALWGLGYGGAFSQGLPPMPMMCLKRFGELDTNRDGRLSLEEFKAIPHPEGNPDRLFRLKDLNRDGYLSKEEFCLGKGKKRKPREGGGTEQ